MEKKTGKKKILGIILAVFVLFSFCFGFFNIEYLFNSPFGENHKWENPLCAVSNEEGYMAVSDSVGTRITLLSPEGKVKSNIQYSVFKSVTPEYVDNISISKDCIILVDHIADENHAKGTYDRVLVYDFKGKCIAKPYSDKNRENIGIYSTAVQGNDLFLAVTDTEEECIKIVKTRDGKKENVHVFPWDCMDIFGIKYNPVSDITTLLTYTGDVIVWEGEKKNIYKFSETDAVISDAVAADDGKLIAINSKADEIIEFETVEDVKKLVSTEAVNLSVCGSRIIFPDQNADTIGVLDRATGQVKEISEVGYSNNIRRQCVLTWIVLIIGAISLVLLLISIIKAAARIIRVSKKEDLLLEETDDKEKPITNLKLYGPLMGVAFVAFAITAGMLGIMFFNSAVDTSRAAVENVSTSVTQFSGESFGDNVRNIKDQRDFGSKDYYRSIGYLNVACNSNKTINDVSEITCSLYKINEYSDEIMVVLDPSGQQKTGTVLTESDQREKGLAEAVDAVRNGEVFNDAVTYSNGTEYQQSYSPVYDSSFHIVGMNMTSINETKFQGKVLHQIIIKVIQAFTLLFGLVLLIIEFALAGRFFRIKKENIRNGIINRTVPEAFRTMDVIFRIPEAMFIIFIYSIVDEVLANQGQTPTLMLVALPITVNALSIFVFRLTVGKYVRRSPENFARISAMCTIGASLLLLMAMKQESYLMLNVSAVAMGLGSGLGMISAKSIRLSLVPSRRYSYIVVERKGVLAAAIAASLGTVLRTMFGKTAIVYFIIFIAIAAIVAASVFMDKDINAPEDKRGRRTLGETLAIYKTMLKRRNTFVFMILVCIPLPFLSLLGTYVLPQINSLYGLPEVFVGAIALIVSAVTLLLSSFLWIIVGSKKDEYWPPVMMGGLAVILLLFSLITTMRLFVLVLIAVALVEAVLMPMAFRQIISESVEAGYDQRDTSPMHELFLSIGVLIGPAIMTASMMVDIRLIGLIWGIVCAVCAVLAAIISYRHRIDIK